MLKRMIIMLLAVTVVLGGVFGYKAFVGVMVKKYMGGMASQPQTISSIKASLQDWQPEIKAVGSLRAVNGADLSAEVSGLVQSIDFESGTDVTAGTPLVHLNAADEIAQLHSLEATAKLASITVDRDEKQFKAQAVSRATLDTDYATLASDNAQVAQQQALIDKKTIHAPFSGRLGIRQIDLGQYLNAGTTIITLQQLDPLYVDFYLPEQDLPKIAVGQKASLKVDAHTDEDFTGEISTINSKVDEATRNVQVRATFKNTEHKLLPGMFGNLTIEVGQPQKYLTLPQTAVIFNPYGTTVFLVQSKDGEDGKSFLTVQQSVITTGETRGDQVAILSGLKDGDEVVTSGQVKLRNGVPILVNNEVVPANDPNPHPHDH